MITADRLTRRAFTQLSLGALMTSKSSAQSGPSARSGPEVSDGLADAWRPLATAIDSGQISAATMVVRQGTDSYGWAAGDAASQDAVFLIASISKPMSIAALMVLFDRGEFRLDDPVAKFLPEFSSNGRESVRMIHLLTHTSGLPDQLTNNASLRKSHAPLPDFVAGALRAELAFAPGSRYSYSSMGTLLAAEVAQRISGVPFRRWIAEQVFKPLKMSRSSLGLGGRAIADTMACQTEQSAEEAGAGDPDASSWDWNSDYWRDFGAPWGGVHASAVDVATFFAAFLNPDGSLFSRETADLMIRNHNPPGMTPRGLGFGVGRSAASRHNSQAAFGHTGATGTLAWADPTSDTVCVVLTTLPGGAVSPHPRKAASDRVAQVTG